MPMQPSPAMFALLDRAYLLVGGMCVFGGPPVAAGDHFAVHGLPCPEGTPVAEHMLEVKGWRAQGCRREAPFSGTKTASTADVHWQSKWEAACWHQVNRHTIHIQIAQLAAAPHAVHELVPNEASNCRRCSCTCPQVVSDPLLLSQLLSSLKTSASKAAAAGAPAPAYSSESEVPVAVIGSLGLDTPGQPQRAKSSGDMGAVEDSELGKQARLPHNDKPAAAAAGRRSRLWHELAVLFWRTLVDILRNPSLLLLHWGMAVGMGLLMGAVFWGVQLDIAGVQNRGGGQFSKRPWVACFAPCAVGSSAQHAQPGLLASNLLHHAACHRKSSQES